MKLAPKWKFQLERGETGYLHYQGRVHLKIKSRKPNKGKFPNLFWNVTSEVNKDNFYYVEKPDTLLAGPWESGERQRETHARTIRIFKIAKPLPISKKITRFFIRTVFFAKRTRNKNFSRPQKVKSAKQLC
jgi:hypothetical protein